MRVSEVSGSDHGEETGNEFGRTLMILFSMKISIIRI